MRFLLVVALLSACVETREREAPALDSATQSVIFAIEHDGTPLELLVRPIEHLTGTLTISEPSRVTLFAFRESLAELQLAEGRVPALEPDDRGRILEPAAAWVSVFGEDAGSWSPAPLDAPELRVPRFDPTECIDDVHCVRRGRCVTDCEVYTPVEIAAARRPAWACPPGWTERALEDNSEISVCEPPPDLGPTIAPCPSGKFASDNFPPNTYYVDAAAAGTADGTRDHPYPTLAEAVARVTGGETIALAAGHYVADLTIREVTIAGRCATETIIMAGATPRALTVSATASISGVTVSASEAPIYVGDQGELQLSSSILISSGGTALVVHGGRARVVDVRLSGGPAAGVLAREGATVSLEHALIRDLPGTGVIADGDRTNVSISDSIIRDTITAEPDVQGIGLAVVDGTATVTRSLIEHATNAGVSVLGGRVHFEDVVVRDITGFNSEEGNGILAFRNAELLLKRVLVERANESAVQVSGGSTLDAEDVVSRCTVPGPASGFGLNINFASTATVQRWHSRGDPRGVTVHEANAKLEDFTSDGRCDAVARTLTGVELTVRSNVTVDRAEVIGPTQHGFFLHDERTRFVLRDVRVDGGVIGVLVRGNLPEKEMPYLNALLERVIVQNTMSAGFEVRGDAFMTCTDCVAEGLGGETRTGAGLNILTLPVGNSSWVGFLSRGFEKGAFIDLSAKASFARGFVHQNIVAVEGPDGEALDSFFENTTFVDNDSILQAQP